MSGAFPTIYSLAPQEPSPSPSTVRLVDEPEANGRSEAQVQVDLTDDVDIDAAEETVDILEVAAATVDLKMGRRSRVVRRNRALELTPAIPGRASSTTVKEPHDQPDRSLQREASSSTTRTHRESGAYRRLRESLPTAAPPIPVRAYSRSFTSIDDEDDAHTRSRANSSPSCQLPARAPSARRVSFEGSVRHRRSQSLASTAEFLDARSSFSRPSSPDRHVSVTRSASTSSDSSAGPATPPMLAIAPTPLIGSRWSAPPEWQVYDIGAETGGSIPAAALALSTALLSDTLRPSISPVVLDKSPIAPPPSELTAPLSFDPVSPSSNLASQSTPRTPTVNRRRSGLLYEKRTRDESPSFAGEDDSDEARAVRQPSLRRIGGKLLALMSATNAKENAVSETSRESDDEVFLPNLARSRKRPSRRPNLRRGSSTRSLPSSNVVEPTPPSLPADAPARIAAVMQPLSSSPDLCPPTPLPDSPTLAFVPPELVLHKHRRRRFHALYEFCRSEERYLADLRTLIRVYFRFLPFVPFLSIEALVALRRNGEEILALHESLHEQIRKIDCDWAHFAALFNSPNEACEEEVEEAHQAVLNGAVRIAKLFAESGRDFQAYESFCSKHEVALTTLRFAESRTEGWQLYEDTCSRAVSEQQATDQSADVSVTPSSPVSPSFPISLEATRVRWQDSSRLRLIDYLIRPVQRICQYPLLLTQLADSLRGGTDVIDDSLQALDDAVGVSKSVAERVDLANRSSHTMAVKNAVVDLRTGRNRRRMSGGIEYSRRDSWWAR